MPNPADVRVSHRPEKLRTYVFQDPLQTITIGRERYTVPVPIDEDFDWWDRLRDFGRCLIGKRPRPLKRTYSIDRYEDEWRLTCVMDHPKPGLIVETLDLRGNMANSTASPLVRQVMRDRYGIDIVDGSVDVEDELRERL